jgi:hypothetical protein
MKLFLSTTRQKAHDLRLMLCPNYVPIGSTDYKGTKRPERTLFKGKPDTRVYNREKGYSRDQWKGSTTNGYTLLWFQSFGVKSLEMQDMVFMTIEHFSLSSGHMTKILISGHREVNAVDELSINLTDLRLELEFRNSKFKFLKKDFVPKAWEAFCFEAVENKELFSYIQHQMEIGYSLVATPVNPELAPITISQLKKKLSRSIPQIEEQGLEITRNGEIYKESLLVGHFVFNGENDL